MKKIAFVIPWYSDTIPGGAEMELREVTSHLHSAQIPVEILTTCIKEFASDWSVNFYKEGNDRTSDGIPIKRFRADKRNAAAFDSVNLKLMNGQAITEKEEEIFLSEMVNSTAMYEYINKHKNDYGLFVFIPYMFGTTYYGASVCPEKSVLIPCFHDEPYAYMTKFKELFPKTAGMIFNAGPEAELADKLYGFSKSSVKTITMGIGMNTSINGSAEDFRRKFSMNEPFILYAGRKDKGKNVHTLIKYYSEYIKRRQTNLRLVLIGGGTISLPEKLIADKRIIDLGFINAQDKYNAQAAAEFLCQPSENESFSLVIMESWLCGRPILVNEACAVTKHFASDSNGGLYFKDYFEFEGCTDYFLKNPEQSALMGQNGKNYVKLNFDWNIIIEKYKSFFAEITGEKQ